MLYTDSVGIWLRVAEYAAFWGISEETVRSWVKRNLVQWKRRGHTLFIFEDSQPTVVLAVITARRNVNGVAIDDDEIDD